VANVILTPAVFSGGGYWRFELARARAKGVARAPELPRVVRRGGSWIIESSVERFRAE
jgi:hypothetical protein